VIWVRRERKYFCKQDWTGQIRLNCFDKSSFRRIAGRRSYSGYGDGIGTDLTAFITDGMRADWEAILSNGLKLDSLLYFAFY
jgi:hypothetical protein